MLLIGRAVGESTLFTFTHEGYNVRGVIHVGANEGQEMHWYLSHKLLPMVCFEPHPDAYNRLVEKWSGWSDDVTFVNCALGNEDGELTMRVPEDGDDEKTSSLIPIPTPGHGWTEVPMADVLRVPVRRFDSWAKESGVYLEAYNALAIDVQGMELQVLEGFGDLLQHFEFLAVEVSRVPVYEGEPSADEVIAWLAERGYHQETPVEDHLDVLFRKIA